MSKAWSDRNFEELANLAHWLKGAGGTVGFDAFTEPALSLEQLAKAQNTEQVGRCDRRTAPDRRPDCSVERCVCAGPDRFDKRTLTTYAKINSIG